MFTQKRTRILVLATVVSGAVFAGFSASASAAPVTIFVTDSQVTKKDSLVFTREELFALRRRAYVNKRCQNEKRRTYAQESITSINAALAKAQFRGGAGTPEVWEPAISLLADDELKEMLVELQTSETSNRETRIGVVQEEIARRAVMPLASVAVPFRPTADLLIPPSDSSDSIASLADSIGNQPVTRTEVPEYLVRDEWMKYAAHRPAERLHARLAEMRGNLTRSLSPADATKIKMIIEILEAELGRRGELGSARTSVPVAPLAGVSLARQMFEMAKSAAARENLVAAPVSVPAPVGVVAPVVTTPVPVAPEARKTVHAPAPQPHAPRAKRFTSEHDVTLSSDEAPRRNAVSELDTDKVDNATSAVPDLTGQNEFDTPESANERVDSIPTASSQTMPVPVAFNPEVSPAPKQRAIVRFRVPSPIETTQAQTAAPAANKRSETQAAPAANKPSEFADTTFGSVDEAIQTMREVIAMTSSSSQAKDEVADDAARLYYRLKELDHPSADIDVLAEGLGIRRERLSTWIAGYNPHFGVDRRALSSTPRFERKLRSRRVRPAIDVVELSSASEDFPSVSHNPTSVADAAAALVALAPPNNDENTEDAPGDEQAAAQPVVDQPAEAMDQPAEAAKQNEIEVIDLTLLPDSDPDAMQIVEPETRRESHKRRKSTKQKAAAKKSRSGDATPTRTESLTQELLKEASEFSAWPRQSKKK